MADHDPNCDYCMGEGAYYRVIQDDPHWGIVQERVECPVKPREDPDD